MIARPRRSGCHLPIYQRLDSSYGSLHLRKIPQAGGLASDIELRHVGAFEERLRKA